MDDERRPMEGYKLKDKFSPKGKRFIFDFSKDECKAINGKCSLECEDLSAENYDYAIDHAKYSKCINLYYGLKESNFIKKKTIPRIIEYDCGHYVCDDGRHRICVAQKMDLTLDVNYNKQEGICMYCENEDS